MRTGVTGATIVAGIVGNPVRHSVSPILHNAWLEAAGLDAVYVPFRPPVDGFGRFVDGLRGGVLRGLNVTIPFKEAAVGVADHVSERARMAGAANILMFDEDGQVSADNTDGLGVLSALAEQAPRFTLAGAVVTVLGAGGGARGALGALLLAGVAEVRIVNRTVGRAQSIADELGGRVKAFRWNQIDGALSGSALLINATSLGLEHQARLDIDLTALPAGAPVMDMVYRPLETPLLAQARAEGRPAVDGLAMLIGQAVPAYVAFFGQEPPTLDVRALAIRALGL